MSRPRVALAAPVSVPVVCSLARSGYAAGERSGGSMQGPVCDEGGPGSRGSTHPMTRPGQIPSSGWLMGLCILMLLQVDVAGRPRPPSVSGAVRMSPLRRS